MLDQATHWIRKAAKGGSKASEGCKVKRLPAGFMKAPERKDNMWIEFFNTLDI
jgi:hypothetical protein